MSTSSLSAPDLALLEAFVAGSRIRSRGHALFLDNDTLTLATIPVARRSRPPLPGSGPTLLWLDLRQPFLVEWLLREVPHLRAGGPALLATFAPPRDRAEAEAWWAMQQGCGAVASALAGRGWRRLTDLPQVRAGRLARARRRWGVAGGGQAPRIEPRDLPLLPGLVERHRTRLRPGTVRRPSPTAVAETWLSAEGEALLKAALPLAAAQRLLLRQAYALLAAGQGSGAGGVSPASSAGDRH